MDKCHICSKKYTDKDVRVRDHCHITGKFRGSASGPAPVGEAATHARTIFYRSKLEFKLFLEVKILSK